jgi:hypothetical protein
MASKIRFVVSMGITIIAFLLTSFIASHAETVTYFYDDLNRLIQIIPEKSVKSDIFQ